MITRKTKETEITASLELYGTGNTKISTGIGFLDHMLDSFCLHGGFDLTLDCKGDLRVDGHHSAEDVGIVLGMAVAGALGERKGIMRFGTAQIPMDEALGQCNIDISGRPFLVFDAQFSCEKVGEFDTCLTEEFFRAFAANAGMTLHIKCLYGSNDHHKIEAMFKSFAYALKQAVKRSGDEGVLSAKGKL